MAEFYPFRGITYNPSRVSLAGVLSPPYHMVSRPLYSDLLAADSSNAVQFVTAPDAASYKSAADLFSALLRDGILTREDDPSLYVVARSYKDSAGIIRQRVGVIGLCRLEDFSSGIIHPHLKTIPRAREDRFRQIQMMNTNTSSVLAFCNNDALETHLQASMSDVPWAEITLENSIVRMWKKSEHAFIRNVFDALRNAALTIAEGHHMYEAALAYRDMMRFSHPGGDEPFNYIMMCIETRLSAATILPVHRVANPQKPVDWDRAALHLARYFKLRPIDSVEQMHLAFAKRTKHIFGMIRNSGMWLCALVDPARIEELAGDGVPPDIRHVDAEILHSFILEKVLQMDVHDQVRLECVQYVHSIDEAVSMVGEEKAEVAFVLSPVQPDDIASAVRSGSLLPPRATWFFPPLPAGLVMRRLDERVG